MSFLVLERAMCPWMGGLRPLQKQQKRVCRLFFVPRVCREMSFWGATKAAQLPRRREPSVLGP